jgi:UDP-galactopyranose mutase
MRRAALDHDVIFFEEPVAEPGRACATYRVETRSLGVRVITPLVPEGIAAHDQLEFQRHVLDELLDGYGPDETVLWYYTPMALRFSDHVRSRACIYDCMDELSAFNFAPPELTRLEAVLFERADVVFVGGASLHEAKRSRHSRCFLFPSSVDVAHFTRARSQLQEPEDQRSILGPRAGFFGVIDERMDLSLVAALAELRPDLQLVFLGPVVKIDRQALPQRENIHWLGIKPYAALPDYLAGWDVGIMPFARNPSTRFISPTKTPEYLAAGVPLCSTPINDVVEPYGRAGLVEIAADAAGFAEKIQLLSERNRAIWLQEVDQHLSNQSWDKTWRGMQQIMNATAHERLLATGRRRTTLPRAVSRV